MIKNPKLLYLALVFFILGALRKHSVSLEDLFSVPRKLDNLPPVWLFALTSGVLAVLSLISWSHKKKNVVKIKRDDFEAESHHMVAKKIMEITSQNEPDIPLTVDYVIFQAIASDASDIHFDPGRNHISVKFRIDGMMIQIALIPMKLMGSISNRLKVLSNLVVYQGYLPQDGRLVENTGSDKSGTSPVDFRIAFMPTLHGERIVIRILGRTGVDLDFGGLGMSQDQQEIMHNLISQPQGMIIFTGPTGSGKTTTIYGVLQAIMKNDSSSRSISTLEDPIEYEISGINQSQVNEKKQFTFNKGLRAILRQDPDVIMVGEIRDSETAKIAIQAGMTGHLIITTVHANSSAATFFRLMEMGMASYSINSAVTAVISQRLLRRACPYCSTLKPVTKSDISKMDMDDANEDFEVVKSSGCHACSNTGWLGRYALFEILEVTQSIRTLITEGASVDAIYKKAMQEGMTDLGTQAVNAVKNGVTTPEEVKRVVIQTSK